MEAMLGPRHMGSLNKGESRPVKMKWGCCGTCHGVAEGYSVNPIWKLTNWKFVEDILVERAPSSEISGRY